MTPIATLADLTVSDGTTSILERVSLELEPGTVTGLVGASGAGKTALALAFLGHLSPGLLRQGGEVRVAGHDPLTRSGRRAIRGRLAAYLPQDPASALDPARTIAAQLRTACRIAHPHTSRSERSVILIDAARDAALEPELLTRRPLRLSGGQAQRALLAWTIIARPELLILDEPTSSLDPQTALRVSRIFTTLPWEPAVLLVSHDRDLIARVSDRVLELDGGRLRPAPSIPIRASVPPMRRAPEESRQPVLVAEGVTILRGGRAVVRDTSLRLEAGEMVAIRGRSGSGKTSLARALSGFAPPAAGALLVDGHPVPWEAGARARGGGPFIAYVGQDARAALHPGETVERTLQRARTAAHDRDTSRFPEPRELLDLVGLPHAAQSRLPSELSGGQRHRLVLARALAASPDVLVCDETTAALDIDTAERILDMLDRIRRDIGLPVLLITHQDAVAARADRTLTLQEGSLV
ncbi:MAG: ABC transporter ATP-binding protein [Microbacterium sp.]